MENTTETSTKNYHITHQNYRRNIIAISENSCKITTIETTAVIADHEAAPDRTIAGLDRDVDPTVDHVDRVPADPTAVADPGRGRNPGDRPVPIVRDRPIAIGINPDPAPGRKAEGNPGREAENRSIVQNLYHQID